MGKSCTSDLRRRVIGFVEAGQSWRQAARHFGVSPSCAGGAGACDLDEAAARMRPAEGQLNACRAGPVARGIDQRFIGGIAVEQLQRMDGTCERFPACAGTGFAGAGDKRSRGRITPSTIGGHLKAPFSSRFQ